MKDLEQIYIYIERERVELSGKHKLSELNE